MLSAYPEQNEQFIADLAKEKAMVAEVAEEKAE
jgi:hypothetical protein